MPQDKTIQVLGRSARSGSVVFSIDDSVPFELAERRLREYLLQCRGLYSRGKVSVNVGRRILAPDQLAAIKNIMARETGLTVSRYWCPPDVLSTALAGPNSRPALPSPPPKADDNPSPLINRRQMPEPRTPAPATAVSPQDQAQTALTSNNNGIRGLKNNGHNNNGLQLAFPALEPTQTICTEIEDATDGYPAPARPEPVEGPGYAALEHPEGASGPEMPRHPVIPAQAGLNYNGPKINGFQSATDGYPTPAHPEPAVGEGLEPAPTLENHALIIKHTCRSGELVHYPGDVLVFGDVNPGAHIIAAGDIFVLGALRGLAHAGADGNLKATILALNLDSHRLQIGPYAAERPPATGKGKRARTPNNPRIAYLQHGSVFVAPFVQRRQEYQGGVPYEG